MFRKGSAAAGAYTRAANFFKGTSKNGGGTSNNSNNSSTN